MATGEKMNCDEAQPLIRDAIRGRLGVAERERVGQHLTTCAACTRLAEEERQLDALLENKLPQHAAPLALKRRLRERLDPLLTGAPPARRARPLRRWTAGLSIAAAAALAVTVGVRQPWHAGGDPLVHEAVGDHLRVLARDRATDVESGGPHQVKPWLTGRLDFAVPTVFGGDADFTLQGGAVGYFLDQKAAEIIYTRRLHKISLFVFRAEGVSFPRPDRTIGHAQGTLKQERGFSVVLWRDGDLGYALVSDLNSNELLQLATLVSAQ